jgi:hypothetical protein
MSYLNVLSDTIGALAMQVQHTAVEGNAVALNP